MSNQELFIYAIDIDGTLIGDVTHQVAEWEMLLRFDKKKLKAFRAQLIEHLQRGLLRPHIADFLTHIKSHNENSEFYLYTASDDRWASFLVPCIEAACGVKFSRPIFSRKHCLNVDRCIKKSLANISKVVHTRLKQKYASKSPTQIYDNMILIDNNKVLIDKESRKCIVCPSYEYTFVYDVLRLIDQRIIESNIHDIGAILLKYELTSKQQSPFHILAAYYEDYASSLKSMNKLMAAQERCRRDKFWLQLGNAIVSLQQKRVTKEAMVKYINGKLGIFSSDKVK